MARFILDIPDQDDGLDGEPKAITTGRLIQLLEFTFGLSKGTVVVMAAPETGSIHFTPEGISSDGYLMTKSVADLPTEFQDALKKLDKLIK